MIHTRQVRRLTVGALVAFSTLLVGFETWRLLRPQARERGQALAQQVAVEVAQNMRALEGDLTAFLLADGLEVAAVAARAAKTRERFAWAHPLFVIDRDGIVQNPPINAHPRYNEALQRDLRQRRFHNLIRRARSQRAIERVTKPTPLTAGREPTLRFTTAHSRHDIHVLINLEPNRLWATYRLNPSRLMQWLTPGTGTSTGTAPWTIRLIDPSGRIVHSSRPGTQQEPVTAAVPIETAPQWGVEVIVQPSAGESPPTWGRTAVHFGGAGVLLALAWTILGRRPTAPSTVRSAPETAPIPDINDSQPKTERLSIGDALIDFDHYTVQNGDTQHPLTDREIALLRLLVAAPNQVVRRERILDEVWGYAADVTTRTVDTFVYRLRQKIEANPQAPRHFLTVRGAGYRFVP